MKVNYHVEVRVNDRVTTLFDSADTNFLGGEANQLGEMFYRILLANGYPPGMAAEALIRAAAVYNNMAKMGDDDQLDGQQSLDMDS